MWISVEDFRLAEEYYILSRGCTPPLLQTVEVDGLTTSNRIQLLKLLNAEQFLAFSNVNVKYGKSRGTSRFH